MEMVTQALVLRATDYGENDKILTLLTADRGKITAGIKGVKKAGAKLKFAAQPFCFAQYILSERGGRYTVINCSECESFFELSYDVCKYYAASSVAEAALSLTFEGDDCANILSACVKTFAKMSSGDEKVALLSFLLEALKVSGYGIAAENCTECGAALENAQKLRFDMDTGSFTCYDCGDGAGVSRVTYNVIRSVQGKSFCNEFVSDEGYKRALRLVREYFLYKIGSELKSLSEYIRLI